MSMKLTFKQDLELKLFIRAPKIRNFVLKFGGLGNEFSLNPGKENWKLEMETPKKFPAKIDFDFHWKSSSLPTATSDF